MTARRAELQFRRSERSDGRVLRAPPVFHFQAPTDHPFAFAASRRRAIAPSWLWRSEGANVVLMAAPGLGLAKPGLLRALLGQARLALRLVKEPAVPTTPKLVLAAAALYLIWPIDFLPDLLPVLGQLDDLGVVLAALELFLKLCPDQPKAFHRDALAAGRRFSTMRAQDVVIDAEFRRE